MLVNVRVNQNSDDQNIERKLFLVYVCLCLACFITNTAQAIFATESDIICFGVPSTHKYLNMDFHVTTAAHQNISAV